MSLTEVRLTSSTREIHAPAARIFELIADPARQPEWDGNDNLAHAAEGQRVRSVGDVFAVALTRGQVRENHVVEFEEGRLIAWKPAEPGRPPVGHLWRWELEPRGDARTLVRHTYDWTDLHDESRLEKARATTAERLAASLDRLAALVERSDARASLPVLADAELVAFLPTTDLDRAAHWFGETLGMSLIETSPFACVFDAHGTTLRVTKVDSLVPAPYTVLGWVVTDLHAADLGLDERGVLFERFPGMDQDDLGIWTTPGGDLVAWFKDPDRNVLSLTQLAHAAS
jgi:uncharacterized protein YndB with AHSA1/START domain/catechol 2,3-dioxygenase-like lactoylglutathione lyase family enzyme